jgi:hypothetical protein
MKEFEKAKMFNNIDAAIADGTLVSYFNRVG